jgi:copper chaperone NosL
MRTLKTTLLFLSIVLVSCSVGPKKINYGTDACHFCKMSIVSQQHAAQIVTAKGKVYMYDAIECMIQDLEERENQKIQHYLVCDFQNPSELIDAKNANYLISPSYPSPMGANLSAFTNEKYISELLGEEEGETYLWDDVKQVIETK